MALLLITLHPFCRTGLPGFLSSDQILMEDYLIAFFLFFVLGLVSVVVLVSVNIDKMKLLNYYF